MLCQPRGASHCLHTEGVLLTPASGASRRVITFQLYACSVEQKGSQKAARPLSRTWVPLSRMLLSECEPQSEDQCYSSQDGNRSRRICNKPIPAPGGWCMKPPVNSYQNPWGHFALMVSKKTWKLSQEGRDLFGGLEIEVPVDRVQQVRIFPHVVHGFG